MTISTTITNVLSIAQRTTPIYLGGSRRMNQLCGAVSGSAPDHGLNPSVPLLESVCVSITESTDYDYYATYSQQLEQFLLANGFSYTDFARFVAKREQYVSGDYSLDDEAVTIVQCENVQIVLRKDAELYKSVFDNIQPWFFVKYLWKSTIDPAMIRTEIKPIFNMLFAIARAALQGK